MATIDYDGDGNDEILVATSEWWNGGGSGERLEVLKGVGAVGPYNVGFRYDATLDADEDGRPDLLQSNYFGTTCLGLADRPVNGVPILLHSLPNGQFSISDEVARRWAITRCPATPVAQDPSDEACATNLSCQLIWGRSPRATLKALPNVRACAGTCIDADNAKQIVSPALPFNALNTNTPKPLVGK